MNMGIIDIAEKSLTQINIGADPVTGLAVYSALLTGLISNMVTVYA